MPDRLDAVTDHFSTTPLARSTMFSSRALPKTICVFRQWPTRLWARPGSAPWATAAAGAIAKTHKVTTSHKVTPLAFIFRGFTIRAPAVMGCVLRAPSCHSSLAPGHAEPLLISSVRCLYLRDHDQRSDSRS